MIPNIEKFNEVEDQIIKNFLPQFCFNDNNRVIANLQIQKNLENKEKNQINLYQNQANEPDYLGLNGIFNKNFI